MASTVKNFSSFGLQDFLSRQPGMSTKPSVDSRIYIEGRFEFNAWKKGYAQISDSYLLQIQIPYLFPRELPVIFEIGGKIPRNGIYHVNGNGSLCLGSRLRILELLSKDPSLTGFAKNCLIPFLYGASHKLIYGGQFPFGELEHEHIGELIDYQDLLGLKTIEQTQRALEYLSMKKNKANKMPCICGCGKLLGQCSFNLKLKKFRKLADRKWFKSISS